MTCLVAGGSRRAAVVERGRAGGRVPSIPAPPCWSAWSGASLAGLNMFRAHSYPDHAPGDAVQGGNPIEHAGHWRRFGYLPDHAILNLEPDLLPDPGPLPMQCKPGRQCESILQRCAQQWYARGPAVPFQVAPYSRRSEAVLS
jgi:hypothetical protein